MNKLQLYINISARGLRNPVNFNPSEDVSCHVTDLRDALECVRYDVSEKNILYMLRYAPQGVFVVVLRTIPGRPLDHLAAWIYVPNGLKISADELLDVVNTVGRKVSGAGVSEADVAELRRLFSREYVADREAASMVAMTGSSYAFCYYATDKRQLADFFGDHIFQPGYRGYKGVLLIDANLGIEGRCADLSGEALYDIVAVEPPQAEGDTFMPYIYEQPFDRPYKAALGCDLQIAWRRPGYNDQIQVVKIDSESCRPDCIETAEAVKTLNRASFHVTSQDTKEALDECVIKVNGREIKGPVTFTQSELQQAQVWVGCEGFFPYSARMDLAGTTQALVQMQERRKVYQFEMPLKSSEYGGPVKFEIRSRKELTGSPIDGYQLLDTIQEGPNRTNYLGYKYGNERMSLWTKLIYAAAGLVAGVLLMLCFRSCGSDTAEPQAAAPAPEQATAAEAPASDVTATVHVAQLPVQDEAAPQPAKETEAQTAGATDAEAIAYLDSKRQWDRSEMEKYPLLRGLWDDLNTYKLTEIRDVWAKKLSASKNFVKVVDAAKKGINKKTNLSRNKSHTPTFNPTDDNVIGFVGWTYYVDP